MQKRDLAVKLIQTDLQWESPALNRKKLAEMLRQCTPAETDLVVLPEMFTTGFSMNVEHAESMAGPTLDWMADWSKRLDAALAGSIMVAEEGKYYNRLIWMRPDGVFDFYDKKHLFGLAKESETYSPGEKRVVVEWRGWQFCLQVCYDLRFPAWSRNVEDYDALVYVANFPAKRHYAWRQLLRARAIENQCYVLAVNVVGVDGKGFHYAGDSALIGPDGRPECELGEKRAVLEGYLRRDSLTSFRKKFPFLHDRDAFRFL